MYATPGERLISAVAAFAMLVLLGYVILFGLTVAPLQRAASQSLVSLSLDAPKPPPVVSRPPPPRHVEGQRAKHAPSPANLRNQATQVIAPKVPPLVLPPPITAAPRSGIGNASNQGASDRIGSGQGAGGEGNGTGGGGNGDGDGDFTPPHYLGGRFDYGDLPRSLREQGLSGRVDVQFTVGADGRVRSCEATRSSGSAALDQSTCRLIEQHYRYAPSRDENGRPVSADMVATHTWTYDRKGYDGK